MFEVSADPLVRVGALAEAVMHVAPERVGGVAQQSVILDVLDGA